MGEGTSPLKRVHLNEKIPIFKVKFKGNRKIHQLESLLFDLEKKKTKPYREGGGRDRRNRRKSTRSKKKSDIRIRTTSPLNSLVVTKPLGKWKRERKRVIMGNAWDEVRSTGRRGQKVTQRGGLAAGGKQKWVGEKVISQARSSGSTLEKRP